MGCCAPFCCISVCFFRRRHTFFFPTSSVGAACAKHKVPAQRLYLLHSVTTLVWPVADPASTKKPRTKKSKKATRVAAESDELNPPQSAGDDAGSDGGIGTSAAATVAAAAAAASPGGTTSAAAASPSLGSGDLSEAEVKPEKKKKKKKKNKEKEKAKKKGKKGTKRPAPQSSDGEGSGDHESGSGGADPSASRRPAAKVRKERASTTPSRGGPNKVIPLFSARRLRPGSLILGVVARVRARHVEVSLPNGTHDDCFFFFFFFFFFVFFLLMLLFLVALVRPVE